jgi:uncharacterized membrane protein (DUF2068 family)
MSHSEGNSDRVVLGIGIFKLVKAIALVIIGVASVLGFAESWIEEAAARLAWAGAFPGSETLRHGVADLMAVNERTIRHVGYAALGYALVFATEGTGLLLRKPWAEWLVVGVTASFIPLEIYELHHRFGPGKLVALAANVAIAIYLAWDRLRSPATARPASPAART